MGKRHRQRASDVKVSKKQQAALRAQEEDDDYLLTSLGFYFHPQRAVWLGPDGERYDTGRPAAIEAANRLLKEIQQ